MPLVRAAFFQLGHALGQRGKLRLLPGINTGQLLGGVGQRFHGDGEFVFLGIDVVGSNRGQTELTHLVLRRARRGMVISSMFVRH